MKHLFAAILFLAGSTTALIASPAKPTWQKVFTAPARISIIYFYDRYLGFIATGAPGGEISQTCIFRTTDGGDTWEKSTVPVAGGCGINELFMDDATRGWALGNAPLGNVLHTNDGGKTWKAVPAQGYAGSLGNSIRRSKLGLIVSDFNSGNILLSSDEGATFRTLYHAPQSDWGLGLDFVDSVHGVAATTFRSLNTWSYTSDGGLTWKPSNCKMESWTIRGMKETSMFFAVPEGYSDNDDYLTEVLRSNDYGKTWYKQSSLTFRATSDLEMVPGAMYLQSGYVGCTHCSFPSGKGIYRSVDSGASWIALGGPETWADTRFAAIATCNGTMILCADRYNNVYKAYDSEIVPLKKISAPLHTEVLAPKPLVFDPCHMQFFTGSISVDECYKLVIEDKSIEGKDSALFSLLYSSYPIVLSGKKDSIVIPLTTMPDTGRYEAFLHLRGHYDIGNGASLPFDTLLPLKLTIVPSGPELLALPPVLSFKPISGCQQDHDAILTLRNAGCDTLTITSGPGAIPAPFTIDSLSLPITLAPGASLPVLGHFYPNEVRDYSAQAIFTSIVHERTQTLTIPLLGKKIEDKPQVMLEPPAINFTTSTICDSAQQQRLRVINSGCDTIRITSVSNTGASAFEIDSIDLPIMLPPDSSIAIEVSFHPTFSGTLTASIGITAIGGSTSSKEVSRLSAVVLAAPMNIAASQPLLSLGLRSSCAPALDSSITFTNNGCDTVIISSGPASAPEGFSFDAITYPIILAPGEHFSLRVHFHPLATAQYSWSPEFIAERRGGFRAVSVSITASGNTGVGILQSTVVTLPFDPITVCSSPVSKTGFLKNSGCDSLVVTSITIDHEQHLVLSALPCPLIIAPGDSVAYTLTFAPGESGAAVTALVSATGHSIHDTNTQYIQIAVSGQVLRGSRILQSSISVLDFGKKSICTNADTLLTIRNTGCDTLTIFGASISSAAFTLGSIPFPLVLPPATSITVPVISKLDTTAHPAFSEAVLQWSSNSDSTANSVLLHREYMYPKTRTLGMQSTITTGAPGDTVLYTILASNINGLESIDLDLEYDSDLLSPVSTAGSNHITLSNGHLHITGDSQLTQENGVIATIAFSVFLSDHQSNIIKVTNPHLNSATPAYEECTEAAIAETAECTFIETARCGDGSIQHQLQKNIQLVITEVFPNPATTSFSIDLLCKQESIASAIVSNQLGKTMFSTDVMLKIGTQRLTIDATNFPAGVYTLTIAGASGSASRQILIVR